MKKFVELNNVLFTTEGLLEVETYDNKISLHYYNQKGAICHYRVSYKNREEMNKDFNKIKNLLTNENFIFINDALMSTKDLMRVSIEEEQYLGYNITFTYSLNDVKESVGNTFYNSVISSRVYYKKDKELRDKDFEYIKMKLL